MTDKSVICIERLRIPRPTQFGNSIFLFNYRNAYSSSKISNGAW